MMLSHKQEHNAPQFSRIRVISFILAVCGALFFPVVKSSYIVGSFCKFFSIRNSIIPLAGAFGGMGGGMFLCLLRLLVSGSFKSLSLSTLALYVPGLFGGFYWAVRSPLMRAGVPLVCMVLFCSHPVGSQAWGYSLFWLIPLLLNSVRHNSIVLESFGSTYTVHAVGSIMWLYANPMAPAVWWALIPVVLVERTFFAFTMTAFYYGFSFVENYLKASFLSRLYTSLPQALRSR